jgi:hypothetical protein
MKNLRNFNRERKAESGVVWQSFTDGYKAFANLKVG